MTVEASTPNYLFVDENPLQLSALRRLIRDIPGRMRTATSGEEALQLAQGEPPTVVITSYHLPGMDGLALLEALREIAPGAIRALHSARPPARFMVPNDVALLLKPYPPEKMRAFLISAGAGKPYVPE